MAKKKGSKSARRKTAKVQATSRWRALSLFISLLLVAVFIFALYVIFWVDWTQGLGIIVAELIIVLLIKLYYKLKR